MWTDRPSRSAVEQADEPLQLGDLLIRVATGRLVLERCEHGGPLGLGMDRERVRMVRTHCVDRSSRGPWSTPSPTATGRPAPRREVRSGRATMGLATPTRGSRRRTWDTMPSKPMDRDQPVRTHGHSHETCAKRTPRVNLPQADLGPLDVLVEPEHVDRVVVALDLRAAADGSRTDRLLVSDAVLAVARKVEVDAVARGPRRDASQPARLQAMFAPSSAGRVPDRVEAHHPRHQPIAERRRIRGHLPRSPRRAPRSTTGCSARAAGVLWSQMTLDHSVARGSRGSGSSSSCGACRTGSPCRTAAGRPWYGIRPEKSVTSGPLFQQGRQEAPRPRRRHRRTAPRPCRRASPDASAG